ncbi:MAG: hypothetical protein AAGJ94_10880 [Pseudomonadota bacterium]
MAVALHTLATTAGAVIKTDAAPGALLRTTFLFATTTYAEINVQFVVEGL